MPRFLSTYLSTYLTYQMQVDFFRWNCVQEHRYFSNFLSPWKAFLGTHSTWLWITVGVWVWTGRTLSSRLVVSPGRGRLGEVLPGWLLLLHSCSFETSYVFTLLLLLLLLTPNTSVACPTAYDQNGNKVNDATTYCPNGTVLPLLCPSGSYCTTPVNIKVILGK